MTTQTIRNGTSIEVVIPTGQTLKVVAVSGTYNASVVRGTGIGTTLSTLATGASYGTYAYDSVVRLVSSDASEIDFDVAVSPVVDSDTEPKFAFDSTGAVAGLVGPGGAVVKIADTSYTLPPTVLRITAAQIVVGKTCKLTSVKCIVGTAITLTVYDNQTLATGSALFSQAMSAGDEAVIPNGVQAINGIYGSFTGTATFDIGVQDAV